ncbi:MAG TPA: hypothetical protein VFO39_10575 [Candidatus Sulfotelmatobacter sp.]|nr:hypothetical protein [Candidatus Sulfotelmatobacter sp.]
MHTLFREIGLYLKAVIWHWWNGMSCALWTFAAIYGEAHQKPEAWYVHASFGLAIAVVCISTFFAWREQNRKLEAELIRIKGYEEKTSELTAVSHMAFDGHVLAGQVPADGAKDAEVADWKRKVEEWLSLTRGLLYQISPIAANKFSQARRLPAGEYYGVCRTLFGELSLLNERLENLTDIMEKSSIYLAKIVD